MKISKKHLALFSALLILGGALFGTPALALPGDDEYGLKSTARFSSILQRYPESLPVFIGQIVGTILSLVAGIFFIVMIYAGFLWMTSRGNKEGADHAMKMILTSSLGLIVMLSAYTLTKFVMNSITKNTAEQVSAPQEAPAEDEILQGLCCSYYLGRSQNGARFLGAATVADCHAYCEEQGATTDPTECTYRQVANVAECE